MSLTRYGFEQHLMQMATVGIPELVSLHHESGDAAAAAGLIMEKSELIAIHAIKKCAELKWWAPLEMAKGKSTFPSINNNISRLLNKHAPDPDSDMTKMAVNKIKKHISQDGNASATQGKKQTRG
ncbi:MAG: hypothetical protein NT051_00575 [Candidatus Micrarchaeota archaeon]|nr:hypothetical protein [Candidatus Micrarchaeota archaeon]